MSAELVHEIHVSELRSYRACRRRWSWLFEENRQPLVTATPLEFGVAFHYAMQTMYNPETWNLDKYALGVRAETAFIQKCREQKAEYLRVTGEYGISDEQEKDYEASLNLGIGMIRWYALNHLPQGDFKAVYVEKKFSVPVLDEHGRQLRCTCTRCLGKIRTLSGAELHQLAIDSQNDGYDYHALPVVYEGRVDAVVEDALGGYWILDWKTTARMMSEDSDVILEVDDQIASYCWALRVKLGLNIRGFLYVELRKGFPLPPVENKNIRLGRRFSVSKSADTDAKIFRETVKVNDAEAFRAGLYDEHIAWLEAESTKFIQVHKLYKPPHTLDNVGHNIFLQTREMISEPAIYPSPGRFSCGWCSFQGPCIDKTAGRDFQYALETMYEIKPRYYETKESSTDRKV